MRKLRLGLRRECKRILRKLVFTYLSRISLQNQSQLALNWKSKTLSISPLSVSLYADEVDRRKDFKKISIGYAILVHERFEYLEDCLRSLFNSELHEHEITIFLIDDESADPRVKDLLEFYKKNCDFVKVIFKPKALSTAGSVINRAIGEMMQFGFFDLLGFSDPDIIYSKTWLTDTINQFKYIKHSDISPKTIFFSPYNSQSTENHRWLAIRETPFGRVIEKRQMGLVSVIFQPRDLLLVGIFDEKPNDEAEMANRMEQLGFVNSTSYLSLVEHIGEKSTLNPLRPSVVPRADFSFKLNSENWGDEINKYHNPTIFRDLRRNEFDVRNHEKFQSIDLLVMVHSKDLHLVRFCIEAARKNSVNKIDNIFLVANLGLKFDLEMIEGATFIDEQELQDKRFLYFLYPEKLDRGNWLFQQFCKLNLDKISGSNPVLVLDADNFLIRPQAFIQDGQILIPVAHDYHHEYFIAYERILKRPPIHTCSNIRHFMVFDKNDLRAMKAEIETLHGTSWQEAIYAIVDLTESSCFSEFELYGHWAIENAPSKYKLSYYTQLELPGVYWQNHDNLQVEYASMYQSIAYPNWKIDIQG